MLRITKQKNGEKVRIHLFGNYPPTTSYADDLHKMDLCEDCLNGDGPNPDGMSMVSTWGIYTEHSLAACGTWAPERI